MPANPFNAVVSHALVFVGAVGCNHNRGLLTRWAHESALQRLHRGLPLDEYELRIVDRFLFARSSRQCI